MSWVKKLLRVGRGKNTGQQQQSSDPPLVRTDFSDEAGWQALLDAIATETEEGFRAYVRPVSEAAFDSATPELVAQSFPDALVIFVADQQALEKGEVLCIDGENSASMFRARARDLWIVENNVSVANMTFDELCEDVDESGVMN